jgi:hypothetical protein
MFDGGCLCKRPEDRRTPRPTASTRPPSEDLARILERLQALELKRGTAATIRIAGLSRLELPEVPFPDVGAFPQRPRARCGPRRIGLPRGPALRGGDVAMRPRPA